MLKVLRNKKTARKIWIGLAIIIIPAFALWGFGGAFRSKEEAAGVGKISGRNVSSLEFKKSLAAVRTTAIMQFGDKLPEIEKYLNLESQAWERLILLSEAKKRRLNIGDKEVIEAIQNTPYFRDKAGFNQKIYEEILRYVFRIQARAYEEQIRENLTLAKLYNQVTKDVKLDDAQIRQEYLKANQELNIDYIASLFSDFIEKIKPTEQASADFFEKNKALFKEPPAKDKLTRIPELAEIKDKVKNYLIKEESEKMAKKKIEECAEKLKNTGFDQAAKTSGLATGQTIFFKSNEQIDKLGKAEIFWEAAKKLKENDPSGILSDEKGYYIIKLRSIKPIDEDKFAKEKEEFGKNLLSARKSKVFADFNTALIKKAQ